MSESAPQGFDKPVVQSAPLESFRLAMGAFPAGVTIVTVLDADGQPVGATVSAFASVSLEPLLVLVSLTSHSRTLDAIASRGVFVIHLVNEPVTELALRFASKVEDKFEGLEYEISHAGLPLLQACELRLECDLENLHEAGDHHLVIGRVRAIHGIEHVEQHPPVVWRGRGFHRLVAI